MDIREDRFELLRLAGNPLQRQPADMVRCGAHAHHASPTEYGSFFALTPDSAHYFFADEDTVIQLNSTGPWGINYVNPKDDPRQKTQ